MKILNLLKTFRLELPGPDIFQLRVYIPESLLDIAPL